ncbi:conserved protein, unknown function [Hepatocystis sp. ex Piliocolobus tephrosceles]|nr:conserved protein, unknown function [Hepatocystis sp. ex Piliocolobus tephrosceles]
MYMLKIAIVLLVTLVNEYELTNAYSLLKRGNDGTNSALINSHNITTNKNDTDNINETDPNSLINIKTDKNFFKIRKNMNKLYNTLYATDIDGIYITREDKYNNNTTMSESSINSNNSYSDNKTKMENEYNENNENTTTTTVNNVISLSKKDSNILKHNNFKKSKFHSAQILNTELKNNNIINAFDKPMYKNNNTEMLYNSNNANINMYIPKNNNINNTNSDMNVNNVYDIYGNNEKMKSESNFAVINYIKDFFQNSPYIKRFKNFVELFFNKYDQRVLESTIFFNFDETLF